MKNIVRCLNNTSTMGVVINCTDLRCSSSCNASFNSEGMGPHQLGCESTAWVLDMGAHMSQVSTRSVKQKTAGASSTDTEILAMHDFSDELEWMGN